MTAGRGFGGQKTKMGENQKAKGHMGNIEEGSASRETAFVLVERRKLDGLQKKGQTAKKIRQQPKKKNQEKQPRVKASFLKDCSLSSAANTWNYALQS